MNWIQEHSGLFLLLGLVIIVVSLLRLTFQRIRKAAERDRQREVAVQAAKAAERKRQRETAVPKSKVPSSKTRMPLGDALGTPFAGNIQGIAAKWEAEVHQIGRQIIGQIDCKMAALQAMTIDANRTANRLEILVEQLEQIAQKQIEWQQQHVAQNAPNGSAAMFPAVISATEPASEAAPLVDVLKELSEDRKDIRTGNWRNTAYSEQPEPVVVLRPGTGDSVPGSTTNLRGEVEMLLNYGLDPQEIARRLNISLGEVDLVLQVQQNRQG